MNLHDHADDEFDLDIRLLEPGEPGVLSGERAQTDEFTCYTKIETQCGTCVTMCSPCPNPTEEGRTCPKTNCQCPTVRGRTCPEDVCPGTARTECPANTRRPCPVCPL